MAQALYRKWRPQTFDDLIGQEHVVRTLRNALRLGHLHHAYLLAGSRGTGKTTTARLLAKAVNCLAPLEERPCDHCDICEAVTAGRLLDLIEIDAASNTGVDDVRELLERVNFQPAEARYKVYVIDEVHMLSNAAFNALLKTLEEPPPHVIFVLATTEVHKIPATVLSRCQRFEFRRVPVELLIQRLQLIASAEGIEAEPEALAMIARTATGSVRDAISLLDQMAAGGVVTSEQVRLILGAERQGVINALVQAWFAGQPAMALEILNRAVDGGADSRQLARQLADFMRGLLLMRMGAEELWTEPTAEERRQFHAVVRQTDPDRLVAAVRLFSEVAAQRGAGWQPQLPLELALVESIQTANTVGSAPSPNLDEGAIAKPLPPPPLPPSVSRLQETPSQLQPSVIDRPPTRMPPAPQSEDVASQMMPSSDGRGLVEAVLGSWGEIKSQMRAVDLSLSALLNDARPLGQDAEGVLVLGFKHSFHRGKVDTVDNRARIEQLVARLVGSSLTIRCELEKDWSGSPVPPTKPSPPHVASPEDPLARDDLVQRAKKDLGAQPKVVG